MQGRKRFETLIKKFLPGIDGIHLSLGVVGLCVNIAPTEKSLEEVLGISKRLGIPVILVLDEFQELMNIGEIALLPIPRKTAQFFQNVALLFAGSGRHVVCDIFSDIERPFYRFSKLVYLGVLDRIKTTRFLKRKFGETLFEVPGHICEAMYQITVGHPCYVQYFAHQLWNKLYFESKMPARI